MNRSPLSLLAPPAAAATLLLGVFSGTAMAQDEPPLSVTGSEGTCGRVTLNGAALSGTYELVVHAGPNDGSAPSDLLGHVTVGADGAAKTFTLQEDAYNGDGFVSWATISGPERDNYVHGAVGVSTDCGVETTEPPPEETPEPDPTGTVPPPATPPEDEDVDPPYESCAEAQEAGEIIPAVQGVNDSYEKIPGGDRDNDGVACEADEFDTAPPANNAGNTGGSGDDSTGDVSDLDGLSFDSPATSVPRGGVDTGWIG